MGTVTGFIAEGGDIGYITDPEQIQKLAVLEVVKKLRQKKATKESARGVEENYAE